MKVKIGVILFLLLTVINVSAQFKSTVERVSEAVENNKASYPIDARPILEKWERENPLEYKKALSKKATDITVWNFNYGDKYNWLSYDLRTGKNNQAYTVSSTCRAVGKYCYIFVEDSSWTNINKKVNQAVVDSVLFAFETKTPNSSPGIYNKSITTFGNPSTKFDSKIIILIQNIRDDYKGSGGYISGYFWSVAETGNNAHIYYLDSDPLSFLNSDGTINPNGLYNGMSTTAHEFQHMIMHNYHPNQETFFNEAWSLVAEVVCGYKLYAQSGSFGYANNTNNFLLAWNNELKDYSRAAKFSLYLYEQFGADILKKFVQSLYNGIDAFDRDVLPKLGTTRRFADILNDWFIANCINSKNVSPGLDRWAYTYQPIVKVNPKYLAPTSSATTEEEGIYKMAAQYFSFSSGKNLTINFNLGTNTAVKVKAFKIGNGSPEIMDVASNANVNFSDFGTVYNTLTFMVYHNDVNASSLGPFTYTYTYSGIPASGTKELAYDNTEPVGFVGQSHGDSIAVKFDAVPGAKLDSVRVAIRNLVPINGRILEYIGFTKQLGGKTYASITAKSKLTQVPDVVDQNGPYPYLQPYPNWATIDLRSANITSDKDFVIEFPIEDPYPGKNRVLSTYHLSTGTEHTIMYKSSTATWSYYGVTGLPDYSWACLIRAYVSYGTSDVSEPIEILPSSFTLSQNYPNPFNPSTVISYQLPKQSRVQIKIYDAIGNEIRSLIDEEKSAGKYNILWDSRNNYGTRVSSGVYFYKITADGFAQTKKMILMK